MGTASSTSVAIKKWAAGSPDRELLLSRATSRFASCSLLGLIESVRRLTKEGGSTDAGLLSGASIRVLASSDSLDLSLLVAVPGIWRLQQDEVCVAVRLGGDVDQGRTRLLPPRDYFVAHILLESYGALGGDRAMMENGAGEAAARSRVGAAGEAAAGAARAGTTAVKSATKTEEDEECCICMEAKCDIVLPCGHAFCSNCSTGWTEVASQNADCPVCRSPIGRGNSGELWFLTSDLDAEGAAEEVKSEFLYDHLLFSLRSKSRLNLCVAMLDDGAELRGLLLSYLPLFPTLGGSNVGIIE